MRWKELDIRFFGQCVQQQYIAFTTAYLLQSVIVTPKIRHVHMHKPPHNQLHTGLGAFAAALESTTFAAQWGPAHWVAVRLAHLHKLECYDVPLHADCRAWFGVCMCIRLDASSRVDIAFESETLMNRRSPFRTPIIGGFSSCLCSAFHTCMCACGVCVCVCVCVCAGAWQM